MKCFIALAICIIINIAVFSQPVISLEDQEKEELIEQLSLSKEDTLKVDLLIKLFKITSQADVKLSKKYANEALELSKKLNYDKGIANSNYSLALIFVDYDFKLSEELILESLQYAKIIKDSLLIAKIENTIGHLKNNQGQYPEALQRFSKSLDYFLNIRSDSLAAAVYNNIAISHTNSGNDSLAMENYFKAAEINERTGNMPWLANNYFNVGYDYLEMGDTVKGMKYLNKSLSIATENNYDRILAYILFSYGQFYAENQKYEQAKIMLQKALVASRDQLNRLLEKNILLSLKDIYYKKGEIDSAYLLQEMIGALNDSIKKDTQRGELNFLEMKYKFQEQIIQNELKAQIREAEHERKESTYIIVILIIGVVLLAFLLLFIFQRDHIRQKSLEQKAIKLENEKLENELEYKKKELTTNVMYLMKKSEFIADISKKLQSIESKFQHDQERFLNNIISELDRNVSEETWLDFETRFQEVHSDFYKKLSEKFPSLTPNDLKLCAFLKLNLSSKDISSLTFQTLDTLKIARHRLRKKLGLSREDNLVNFLNQI